MSEIKFACPHCQQHLEAPPDMAGDSLACPSCNEAIRVPTAPGGALPANEVTLETSTSGSALSEEAAAETSLTISAKPRTSPPEERPAGGEDSTVFSEPGQWGTVADSFGAQVIYHGTRLRGDTSIPLAITVSGETVELHARSLSRKEIRSFLVQYLPWLAGAIMAPFQHMLGLGFVPVQFVLSILSPLTIPFVWPALILEGIGHVVGLFVSPFHLCIFIGQYFKAIIALVTGNEFVFIPRGLVLQDGRIAALSASDRCQFIRLQVSDRLLKRVVKKMKKAEEEEMGLVGIVIGLFQLSLLPLTIPLSILGAFLRLFGVGRRQRTLFAFVQGAQIDLEEPAGILSRLKKRRQEKADQASRMLYLVNIPSNTADAFQSAVERSLSTSANLIDDKLARETIWRDFA